MGYLSRATLDIIGEVGFNYELDTLHPISKVRPFSPLFCLLPSPLPLHALPPNSNTNVVANTNCPNTNRTGSVEDNDLSGTLARLFQPAGGNNGLCFLQAWFPVFRAIAAPSSTRASPCTTSRIGRKLLDDAHAATASGDIGDGGRELLSLLVKVHTDPALPVDQRMADSECRGRCRRFWSWGMRMLDVQSLLRGELLATNLGDLPSIRSIDVQSLLRGELLATNLGDLPSMEDPNALPYLVRVLRSVLRLYLPMPRTVRMANATNDIPCETVWVDKKGVERR
ncbi:hypothetical protein FIBSPDRAFT_964007 [Athelia psychrophila]|uniref:Cytochrome P450 n=1 Tax=Athelia psychrophila TaxID=1759441 RepID=A0A165YBC6_9AGAM|nr:hypothetical protein FIBSPDRAFT_964007 [Fibularhizoctonia sp. CBS 109695]